jgi:hypothetical protein
MAKLVKEDVLLVGFGAIGAICAFFVTIPCLPSLNFTKDSYILNTSGMAIVTSVARSNYEVVNGEECVPVAFSFVRTILWFILMGFENMECISRVPNMDTFVVGNLIDVSSISMTHKYTQHSA